MNRKFIVRVALYQSLFVGFVALYTFVLNMPKSETIIIAAFDVLLIAVCEMGSRE